MLFVLKCVMLHLQALGEVMMATREPLEWHFKQLDHSVGLSFKCEYRNIIQYW